MKSLALAAAFGFTLVLGACSSDSPAENTAETLEEAAEYSTPEAAEVLENAAETVREKDLADPEIGDAAMREAGNAQAPAPPPRAQGE